MNLMGMDKEQFLIKLRGLIKKISRSHSSQIKSHTQKCHSIIVGLIQDHDLLQNMNSHQVRLLAYESVLFLVEMMNVKNEEQKSKNMKRNKIEMFLCQIYETLAAIKQFMKNIDAATNKNTYMKRGMNNINHMNELNQMNQMNDLGRIHSNLERYQERIGNIMTKFQSDNNIQTKTQQPIDTQKQQVQDNEFLIEQMHRIIQKKQEKISQLTSLFQKTHLQNTHLSISFNQTLHQYQQTNQSLLNKIEQLTRLNDKLLQDRQEQNLQFLQNEKQKIQQRLVIQQIVNQKILNTHSSYQNTPFNHTIQNITQSTIPSAKSVLKNHHSSRKFSLENTGSVKSFRRICSRDEKDSISVDKRYSDLNEKNEQLYRLLLSQAAIIEELL